MKRCLNCSQVFETFDWHCPCCGWRPEKNDKIPVFAPELGLNNNGFRASSFALLASLEANYFWFRVRNALIIWSIKKYGPSITSFMEIGCGTGFVLQGIAKNFPKICLVASDIYPEGIIFATERVRNGEFMQMDARQIPFIDEFDAIGAFDVIEHIQEDEIVLQQIQGSLKPHGLLLLTVPQHRWLWSKLDENACHIRRYTKQDLYKKLKIAGFQVIRSTSFVTSLLPCIFFSRMLQHDKPALSAAMAEIQINPILNRFFEKILRMELKLIQAGVSFPVGGSRLIVATKNPHK
jgi:SAM-dependent methyltransferase